MSSPRAILLLIAVPVIIGLLAGIAVYGLENVIQFFLFMIGVFIVLWIMSKLAQAYVNKTGRPKVDLIHPERDTPLESGYYEEVDRYTKILHADGYAFEVTNKYNGKLQWREVDPASRMPISTWIQRHPKDLRGDARVAQEYITTTVNKRKGVS